MSLKSGRRTAKHLKEQFNDLGYWDKLSPNDKSWMFQFMYEYYQADFNFTSPLHPKELRKDCMDRNNSTRRQIHSVGWNILEQSIFKALNIHNGVDNRQKARFYTHLDYIKNPINDFDEDNR